jgi:hypothetical protein
MAQVVTCRPLSAEDEFAGIPVHVGFVVDRVVLGEVYLQVLRYSLPYHSTVALHTYISSGG